MYVTSYKDKKSGSNCLPYEMLLAILNKDSRFIEKRYLVINFIPLFSQNVFKENWHICNSNPSIARAQNWARSVETA